MNYEQSTVENNEQKQRYEVKMGEYVAVLSYERRGKTLIFLHTGVPEALEGHGIANKLAHFALEEARSQQLTVVPLCPFVTSYIRRHQEYLSLLTAAEQKRVMQG